MPNNNFPWDLFIIPAAVGLIAGCILMAVLLDIKPSAVTPSQPAISNANLQGYQNNSEHFIDEFNSLCADAGFTHAEWSKEDVVCCFEQDRLRICEDILSLSKAYQTNKKTQANLKEAYKFIDAYLPNQYYCLVDVPVKYKLPIKAHYDVEKTRMVNKTVPVYEQLVVELDIGKQDSRKWNFISNTTIISNNTLAIKDAKIIFNNLSAGVYLLEDFDDIEYDENKFFYINEVKDLETGKYSEIKIKLVHAASLSWTITFKKQVREETIQTTETYTEDVYDYKEEIKRVSKIIQVNVPLNLNLTERKKLRKEMESNNCFLTSEEANLLFFDDTSIIATK